MRKILTVTIITFFLSNAFAHSLDTVIYKNENVIIEKNTNTGLLTLTANKTYENLKFAKLVYQYIQVLDADNHLFYVGKDGEEYKKVDDFIGVCGTVPHYTLTVQKTATHLIVYEDEIGYDSGNQIPPTKVDSVSLLEADSIVFINGKSGFKFDDNFDVGIVLTDPRDIILMKDGKYFTRDSPELKYDNIIFSNYYHSLITQVGNLYGVLGVVEPKYQQIAKFEYYLAKAITQSGKEVYIDIEGNEY